MTVKLGLIGLGRWGQNYIRTVQDMPGVEISAVCRKTNCRPDFVPENATFHTDHRDLLSSELGLDGIIVAVEDCLPITWDILNRSIPILAEKPLITKERQIAVLNRAVYNRKLMVNYIHLFSSPFKKLQEIVRGKEITRICSSGFGPSPTREYFSPLWDYGPHDLSMILTLMDKEPTDIHITPRHKTREGQTYRINLNFDGIKTKSIVGNGTLVKSRYLSVGFIDGGREREVVYDDCGKNKLLLDGAAISYPEQISPLRSVIEAFVEMIGSDEIDPFYRDLTIKITKILGTFEEE